MLFNLYYEKALETISPYADLLLVFADDLAIIKKHVENLQQIVHSLNRWGRNYNLLVNEKPIYVKYPICTKFKYLGTEISNDKNNLTRKIIFQKIKEMTRKFQWSNIKNTNAKARKLTIIWWLISILYYYFITDVYLGYISIEVFKQKSTISIKTVLGIKKGVKQKFTTGFYRLKIKRTIKRMLNSLFYKKSHAETQDSDDTEQKL